MMNERQQKTVKRLFKHPAFAELTPYRATFEDLKWEGRFMVQISYGWPCYPNENIGLLTFIVNRRGRYRSIRILA
jgi:hypothetical protein